MPQARHWRGSRPMLIAGMLPLAVVLGSGVANASPDAAAPAPATSPMTTDWLSLIHRERGQPPFPLPTDRAVGQASSLTVASRPQVETNAPASPSAEYQEPIQAFCRHVPVDPRRCTATAVDAGAGAAIGAGIALGVVAPVAIAAGTVAAVAGFVAGIPFLPTGLVVGPLAGAAVGVAVIAGPAALLGGAFGAAVGAITGITTPLPQVDGHNAGSGAPTTSPI